MDPLTKQQDVYSVICIKVKWKLKILTVVCTLEKTTCKVCFMIYLL